MAGISTGPSTGFFGRMMQNLPNAVNRAAQTYGDPRLQGINRTIGSMMPPNGRPIFGGSSPSPMMGEMPGSNTYGGMVRTPNLPIFQRNNMSNNTGITGGMQFPMVGGGSDMTQNPGGLWQMYSQLQRPQPMPQRQLFY